MKEKRRKIIATMRVYALMIIAVVWLTPVMVRAENVGNVEITENGTQTIVVKNVTDDNEERLITLVNKSNMSVCITVDSKSDYVSGKGAATQPPYISTSKWTGSVNGDVLALAAGQSAAIEVKANWGNKKVYDTTVSITATLEKAYPQVSIDSEHPAVYPFGQEVRGPLYMATGNYYKQYYTFTLQDAATIEGTYIAESGWMQLSGSDRNEKVYPGNPIKWKLEAGTYSIVMYGVSSASGNAYLGKEYALNLTSTPYNWGTVQVQWNVDNLAAPCDIPVTVSITGASESKLDAAGTTSQISDTLQQRTPGYYTYQVTVYAGDYGTKTFTYNYCVKPEKANLVKAYCGVTTNSLSVGNTTGYNNVLPKIQIKQNGQWQTMDSKFYDSTGQTIVKGLKPDTEYQVRLVNVYDNGKEPALEGTPSKEITICTGTDKKVAVKSIKVYGFKKYKTKKVWNKGYWALGRWNAGYYSGGKWMTSYKIKVTLKKKVPGLKTKYLFINGSQCKVKGKSYVAYGEYSGTQKKKKMVVTIKTAKDKEYGGFGAIVRKTVKVK